MLRTHYWITTPRELAALAGTLRADLTRLHGLSGLDDESLEELISLSRDQLSEEELASVNGGCEPPPMGLIRENRDEALGGEDANLEENGHDNQD